MLLLGLDDSVYRRLKELKNSAATKEKIDNKENEMRAVQFKILDLVRPILFICETSEESVRNAAKVAIKQWAHAFFTSTDYRRNSLLKQTNPSFVAMLKREKNFDEKEFDMLFGDSFLKALLKTAKADAVLAAIPNGRSGGPSNRPSSGGRGGRGYHATGNIQVSRFNGSQQQSGRGGFHFANHHQPFIHRGGSRGGFSNGRLQGCQRPFRGDRFYNKSYKVQSIPGTDYGIPGTRHLIIYSDACLSGWGGHCNGVTTRAPWCNDDHTRHINDLQLMAAFNCLKSFAPHATNISVLLSHSFNGIAVEMMMWCESRFISSRLNLNPMSSDLTFSTINVARLMLSSTLTAIDGFPIGKHPLVTKLMDGIFNLILPKPRYHSTCNVDIVLHYLKSLSENENLNLSQTSKKLAILLALTTLLRVSEIASIARLSINFVDDKVSFSLSKPRKAQHDGARHSFSLQKYLEEPKLCPVSCLGHYIYLTGTARNDSNSELLLMATVRPFKAVTGSIVGRWIKSILTEAGVDPIFSAHSARGAVA
ncbi:hypothetical protein GHT06_018466 [Daphnia sinensis]|uniref:Tyr recombinase domain-containing protein n=1 Tax=Daphnia sinensis TaxID=1820382 RepID=A0AAD5PT64_9CRUS|nr:hypothetical protein GHT06_018466 [Daphnia sinensis]